MTLKGARQRRDDARMLLADGVDPGEARKAHKAARTAGAANTFEAIAREWHAKHSPVWASSNADKVMQRLTKDVFPWLGGRPIAAISAPDLLTTLRRIESRGAVDTAHRALQNCGQVFRYAVATGRADRDPTADQAVLPFLGSNTGGESLAKKHEKFAVAYLLCSNNNGDE